MARPQDTPPVGRALQWSDLASHQRRIVSDNLRDAGENLPKTVHAAFERNSAAAADPSRPATRRALYDRNARTLEAVQPHVKAQPVTLQRAANSRQALYNRGIEDRAQQNPHDTHQVIPTGAGWYFEHHKAIRESAEKTGFPHTWAIAASGVMSPQNSPENERAAVGAMMDAYANHTVHVTPEIHEHLAKSGIDVSQHVGKRVGFDQLPTGTLGQLSSGSIRNKVDTGANLHQIARGGTKQNIARAENVLMGHVAPEDAVNPHSAPKVWSYVHNTIQAEPGSATHVEYMGRVHQDALVRRGQISPDQQALDLYGHGEKTGSDLLSPHSHTVEDTWQNAASFDQPKKIVNRATSVFKTAGSMDETYPVKGVKTRVNEETGKRESAFAHADIGPSAITHAFNNRATQKAAEQQSRGSHVTVPPVAVQEVGWVQMRKDAGKDPAWNQREQEKVDPLGGHIKGQGALWGEHIPGAGKTVLDRDQAPLSSHQFVDNPEADMRKWAAIGNNTRAARSRAARAAGRIPEL